MSKEPSYPSQPAEAQGAPESASVVRRLPGSPVHLLLMAACVIAIVALFLPWYSPRVSSRVGWKTTGYEYSDGSRSTWDLPEASTSRYGGGNGLNLFTLALAVSIGGLAFKFRSGAWPRWGIYTLAAVVALVTFIGIINVAEDANIGPLLYAVAGAVAMPAVYKLFRSRSAGGNPAPDRSSANS